ncbi:membrane-anchored junction protein isoform X2 [Boleophthalmus pectinirostris]|uniref:membrane-anchored junction protein isoform X2 n=1 Tax=Boleophthalmus pectinirostris TaxID=150288 RepID=UPI0024312132|nr:membrane-anchored junction protein isoform X2 [Boleophthalmus pectinirostris]
MPLHPFSFPFPQTRFFKAGTNIYKLKIRGGSSYSGVEATGGHLYNLEHEMEDIIRTVLGNLESLQPFTSTHFHIYPYKKPWERVSQVMCKHGEEALKAYPFTLLLYLEKNTHRDSFTRDTVDRRQEASEEPQQDLYEHSSKRQMTDSPLEDAILQDMVEDMEAETVVSVLSLLMWIQSQMKKKVMRRRMKRLVVKTLR